MPYSRAVYTLLGSVVLAGCSSPTPSTDEQSRANESVVSVPAGESSAGSPEQPSPPAPPPSPRVRAIGVGEHISCALLERGEVYCWGATRLTAVASTATPSPVGLRDVVSLAVGTNHTCVARADGSVHCWGRNHHGQLGDGTTNDLGVPTQVAGAEGIVEVVAGGGHTCARDRDGAVFCWGHDGSVGHWRSRSARRPGRVAGIKAATRLVAGDDITCAFSADGPPRCWGFNTTGLLDPSLGPVMRATPSPALEHSVELALGDRHACFADANHRVWCMGNDAHGQLGDQRIPDKAHCRTGYTEHEGEWVSCIWTEPAPVRRRAVRFDDPPPPGPTNHEIRFPKRRGLVAVGDVRATALAAGDGRSCALSLSRTITCWGQWYSNDWAFRIPRAIEGTEGAIAIAVAQEHACALMADHSVRCWGYNRAGELGTGEFTETMEPSPAAAPVRW